MSNKVTVHRKRRLLDDFFAIDEVEVSYEGTDGRMRGPVRRLSFERGDSVAALLLRTGPTPAIVVVRQFKYPVSVHDDGWITETVAGMVERGEDKLDALRREILEEVGYRATSIEHVATFYPSPGGSSERVFLYFCEVAETDRVPGAGGGVATEGEDIEILEYGLDEFFTKLEQAAFFDPKLIVAGLWLRDRMRDRPARS